MKHGPNVKNLIVRKVSIDAIPPGGGLEDGIRFLSNPGRLVTTMRAATAWVETAIEAVRQAPEPNEWKNADDETIATVIMQQVAELERQRRVKGST